jgi:glycerol-3-phosphate dehydrogenase
MGLFMDDLNAAIPGLGVTRRDILHVFAGFIPVQADGTLRFTRNDYVVDHATHRGPAGLYSIGGTKFTAARSTAEAVLKQVFPNHTAPMSLKEMLRKMRREHAANCGRFDYQWFPNGLESTWRPPLRRIIEEEAVCHLDDLILRRTTLGDNPARARAIAPLLCDLFDWSAHRREEEMQRLETHFRWTPASNET